MGIDEDRQSPSVSHSSSPASTINNTMMVGNNIIFFHKPTRINKSIVYICHNERS